LDLSLLGQNTISAQSAQVLLLCNDPAWVVAAEVEVSKTGSVLDRASSATEALYHLVEPSHRISHLLLEPAAAGTMVRDLVGVSAGEFGSQVELILLGEVTGLPGGSGIINARTPGDLGRALREHRPPSANRPSMSTSDVALTFDARDVDCRFQPIVRLTDRAPVGMETLVRLNHQEYGTIGPDQFIPQIERAGLSLRLTDAVAYAAMASVDPALLDYRHLFVSINLPLDVLLFPEALQRIEGHRQQFAIPVERILIELTESRPVSDLAGLTYALERWRNAGYRVAIDDMGPEMMNQLNLFDLPFNVVKLDKQVVLRSQTDLLARNYLKRTVNNAKSRSLEVIAEGIENEAMWVRMRDMDVEYGQGFLIARALPAAALPIWLEAWSNQLALPPDREPT
jgi:EAL domain-containing protein (putative c-di-GMP-specific phosphodiesterase class I)